MEPLRGGEGNGLTPMGPGKSRCLLPLAHPHKWGPRGKRHGGWRSAGPVPPGLCVLAAGKAGSCELNMKQAFEVG